MDVRRVVNQGVLLKSLLYQDSPRLSRSSLSLTLCLINARLSRIIPEWLA